MHTETPPVLTYYGSLAGVRKALTSASLPMFEAHELSDPFIPTRFTEIDFTESDLFEGAVRYMSNAILGRFAPNVPGIHPMQKAIRRWRMEHRFSDEEEIRKALQGLLPAMVEQALKDTQERHQQWRNFISARKIIPFFESGKDAMLWMTEGDRHQGIALRFNCREESFLDLSKPVRYSKRPASTVDMEETIHLMVGHLQQIELNFEDIIQTQNYSLRWQKEWRYVHVGDHGPKPWLSFDPELVQSVFIGALVPETNVNEILIEAELLNPKIRVFQMQPKADSYELEAVPISDDPMAESTIAEAEHLG